MAEANVTTDSSAPKALDVPTTDVNDLVKPNTEGYYEQEDWRPEPLYQYGTLDTSDTAGAAHQSVAEVSPVFQEARARTLVTAARALDPEDDGVGEEMVTLPTAAQGGRGGRGRRRPEGRERDGLPGRQHRDHRHHGGVHRAALARGHLGGRPPDGRQEELIKLSVATGKEGPPDVSRSGGPSVSCPFSCRGA
jgi:hypothetical protein